MKLLVVSHKPCWPCSNSQTGFATDGGFPFQMRALSELFETTTLIVPCSPAYDKNGEVPLTGHNLSIAPVTSPYGRRVWRKTLFPFWILRNSFTIIRELLRADAVHTPIPGDIGTIGMMLAFVLHKPLIVRHCGNWFVQRTAAERFWKWIMERFAGGTNIMLATGGAAEAPSQRNKAIRWIFSTTLTERELKECNTSRTKMPKGQPRLIIVCRQEKEKGTGAIIESLPLILKDFPGAMLDVVGDGGALAQFKRLADSLGVSDRIIFHGKVDHSKVIRLLKQADLFCYPTAASEGFPKVVLEAMACGLPVLTTRVSVLPSLIEGGGLLIDEVSSARVAQAVFKSLSDRDLYCSMSRKAIETAREYSLERWRDTIGDLLRSAWGPLRSDA